MISTREKDMPVEREVAAFLDKHLYSNTDIFSEFVRTDGKTEQLQGSDVILSTADNKVYRKIVDEKVSIKYTNINLSTFAMELSSINNAGKRQNGWFIDSSKTTEYYMLMWILKADIPFDEKSGEWVYHEVNRDNIRKLQWALVSRQKIMKFLEENNWGLYNIEEQVKKILERGYINEKYKKTFVRGVRFTYSKNNENMKEMPINLLIKKEVYLELADAKGIIYNN